MLNITYRRIVNAYGVFPAPPVAIFGDATSKIDTRPRPGEAIHAQQPTPRALFIGIQSNMQVECKSKVQVKSYHQKNDFLPTQINAF